MKCIAMMLLFYVLNTTGFQSGRRIVKENWFPRADFPCRHIKWTCEHVVPKSLIPEHNDLNNLILLPDRLNNIRSNYPYINGTNYNDIHNPNLKVKLVSPCMLANCSCADLQGKLISNKLFIPSDRFKGMIGRSVLRMNEKFPQHTNLIHRRVLDLGVASIWDMSFPPSQNEIDWKKLINAYQGYRNMKIDFEEFNNIKKKTDQR